MDTDEGPAQLRLDAAVLDAYLRGQPLGLTRREFQLLSVLVDHPNEVVSSEQLLEAMWGDTSVGDDHPIHVNISRLRAKLGRDGGPATMIRTVRGRGYTYTPSTPEAQIVHLLYDRDLVLRSVEPADRPFLGWYPANVVDTFFLLTTFIQVYSSRRIALAIARVWAATGIDGWSGPMAVRTSDGGVRIVTAEVAILSRNRRFQGMSATVHL